jgi:flavin-dependent dehydrogenase
MNSIMPDTEQQRTIRMPGARWDALIIGGGLAGSAAACCLARAGKKTLLIEKEARAHHKVCGEFLSFEAQTYLRKLGVNLGTLGATPLRFVRLSMGRQSARARLPFTALSLSRFVLDEHLLALAAAYGAEIRRGYKATRLMSVDRRWQAEANGLADVEADAIFLATGKHDLNGSKRPPGRQNDFIGFKMHFTCTARQRQALSLHTDIMLFDGGYAGLQPIEDGKANLCLLIDKHRFAELGRNWQALLVDLAQSSVHLSEFLEEAIPCWRRPIAIASLPYGYIHAPSGEREGVYRLGDQFAVIPSFSGEGMSIALHTAKLSVNNFLSNGTAMDFHRRARQEIKPQMRIALRLARIIEKPAIRGLGFAACRFFPTLMTQVTKQTRLRAFVSG